MDILNELRNVYSKYILTFIIFLGGLAVAEASPSVEAWRKGPDPFGKQSWEHIGEDDGVKLGRKFYKKVGLYAVRGELLIDAPIETVASIIYDESRWVEWSLATKSARLLEADPKGMKTVLQEVDMPMPLSDRYMVYTFGGTKVGDQLIFIGRSLPYRKINNDGVQMSLTEGRWFLTPQGKKTHVVLEILLDPKGYLPKWFVNLAQRSYPSGALVAIAKHAKRKDIKPYKMP